MSAALGKRSEALELKDQTKVIEDVGSFAAGDAEHEEDKSSTVEINAEYAFVLIDGKDFIINRKDCTLSPVQSIKNLMSNRFAVDSEGEDIGRHVGNEFRQAQAFDVWMKSPLRRTYTGVVFDPQSTNSSHEFNLYRGMSITPEEGECGLILSHIRQIWCQENDAVYEYVLNWLARMFQKPWKPGQSIITLSSDEGTGKGIITDIFAEAFKHHSLIAMHQRDITGQFNYEIGMSIFVCLNEAIWGGKKDEEGILKSLATDKYLTVEKKWVQKFRVKNCTHIIITSNNYWYAPLDKTDRRYLTLTLDNSIIGNHEYFDALIEQIESGGKAAFIHFLMNRDIDGFHPKLIPKVNTEERAGLKMEGQPSHVKWIVDLVEGGELTTVTDNLCQNKVGLWDGGAVEVRRRILLDDYKEYASSHRYHIETDTKVGKFLHEIIGIDRSRESTGERNLTYILPSLIECKERIIEFLGGDSPFSEE